MTGLIQITRSITFKIPATSNRATHSILRGTESKYDERRWKSWSDITVSSCGISRLREIRHKSLHLSFAFYARIRIWTGDAAEEEKSPTATDWIRGISRSAACAPSCSSIF